MRIRADRFTYSEPLVVENLLDGDPMIYVGGEHPLYEVFRRLADGIPEWCLHLQIQLKRNYSSRAANHCAPLGQPNGCAERAFIKIPRPLRFSSGLAALGAALRS